MLMNPKAESKQWRFWLGHTVTNASSSKIGFFKRCVVVPLLLFIGSMYGIFTHIWQKIMVSRWIYHTRILWVVNKPIKLPSFKELRRLISLLPNHLWHYHLMMKNSEMESWHWWLSLFCLNAWTKKSKDCSPSWMGGLSWWWIPW